MTTRITTSFHPSFHLPVRRRALNPAPKPAPKKTAAPIAPRKTRTPFNLTSPSAASKVANTKAVANAAAPAAVTPPSFEVAASTFNSAISSFTSTMTSLMASFPQDYQKAIKGAMDTMSAAMTVISATVEVAKAAHPVASPLPANEVPVETPVAVDTTPAHPVSTETVAETSTPRTGGTEGGETVADNPTLPLSDTPDVAQKDSVPSQPSEVYGPELPPAQVADTSPAQDAVPAGNADENADLGNNVPVDNTPVEAASNEQGVIDTSNTSGNTVPPGGVEVAARDDAAPAADGSAAITAAFQEAIANYSSRVNVSDPHVLGLGENQQVNMSA